MPDTGLAERSEVISTLGECLPRILGGFRMYRGYLVEKIT